MCSDPPPPAQDVCQSKGRPSHQSEVEGGSFPSLDCWTQDTTNNSPPVVWLPEESRPSSLLHHSEQPCSLCHGLCSACSRIAAFIIVFVANVHIGWSDNGIVDTEICPPARTLYRNNKRKASSLCELLYLLCWHITPTIILDTNHVFIFPKNLFFFFLAKGMLLHTYLAQFL